MLNVSYKAETSRLRWLIVALIPPVAALGPYLLPIEIFGVNLYAFRVLIIVIFILLTFYNKGVVSVGGSVSKFYFFLGYLWLAWGITSLLCWSPEFIPGMTEVFAIGFGFLTGLVLLNLVPSSEKYLQALRTGWVLAYIVSAAVAIWEMSSGEHLSGSFSEYLSGRDHIDLLNSTVFSTFGHPNNYSAFLAICFPFLLWSVLVSRGIVKLLLLISLAGLPVLLVMAGGRLGIVALVLELLLFFLVSGRSLRSLSNGSLALLLVSTALIISLQTSTFALSKISNVFHEVQTSGSASDRINLVLNGIWFAINSYGLGIGAGGFEYMIEHGYGLYPTVLSINPHNFWIEILSQYGIVIFVGFVTWFACVTILAWRTRKAALKRKEMDTRLTAEIVLIALLGYLFAATENSAYIDQPMNWVFLGSILAMASYLARMGFWRDILARRGDGTLG